MESLHVVGVPPPTIWWLQVLGPYRSHFVTYDYELKLPIYRLYTFCTEIENESSTRYFIYNGKITLDIWEA